MIRILPSSTPLERSPCIHSWRSQTGAWSWLLHRVTGVGVLVFLLFHIVDTALRDLRGMARVGLGLARGTIRVPRLALRESVYAKSAALPAPAPAASHSVGARR